MIKTFRNRGTEDLFNGVDSKVARKVCDPRIWTVARRKLDAVNAAKVLGDLRGPGYSLEELKHDRPGHHAIRVNDKYRVVFRFDNGDAFEVEVTDYH